MTPIKARITAKDAADITLRLKSGATLARELGSSPAYVNAVLRNQTVKRIKGPQYAARQAASVLRQARLEYRTEVARLVHAGSITMEQACQRTGATSRTIFRHLAEVRNESA
jgi:hypothetical protein